jgi:hypothetical protein
MRDIAETIGRGLKVLVISIFRGKLQTILAGGVFSQGQTF